MNKKNEDFYSSFFFPRTRSLGFNESHVEVLIKHINLMLFHN